MSFLLVDFKGGAAFEPVRGLPHVTGIVTDLDEGEAERAVLSLRAELRHREEVLRAERVREISELARASPIDCYGACVTMPRSRELGRSRSP